MNDRKLEGNYKKRTGKTKCILNNMLLNNYWVIKKIKGEIRKYLDTMKTEIGHNKSQ